MDINWIVMSIVVYDELIVKKEGEINIVVILFIFSD